MRKIFIVAIIAMLLLASGCGGAKESPQSVSDDSEKAQQAPAVKGETYETERFSLTVPEGWSVMDVDGGVQLYKMSGEVFELHYRGSNQGEEHAKQQAEWLAEQYEGTEPEQTDFLGKRFWTTTFTGLGVPQVSYLCIEDGMLLSVKYGGPNYETNPDFSAILDSVVFKPAN